MKNNRLTIIVFILGLFMAKTALSQPICPLKGSLSGREGIKSFEVFKRIPILENGRVKPLETYAQNVLLQFSGKRTFNQKPAISWLARLLFSPESTRQDKIFLINNPAIPESLGIKPDLKRRYSFAEIESQVDHVRQLATAAKQIDSKERDIVENELIRLWDNIRLYSSLSLSFSFAMPHNDFTLTDRENLEQLALPSSQKQFSFIDIALRAKNLQKMTRSLEALPSDHWSPAQQELLQVVDHLFQWSVLYHDLPFRIIPSYTDRDQSWYSPWDVMTGALTEIQGRVELLALRDMLVSYDNSDQLEFDLAGKIFSKAIHQRMESENLSAIKNINLEIFYNQAQLFLWAKCLYGIIFLFFLISLINHSSRIYNLSWILLGIGFLAQLISMLIRVAILHRPPVSNLYETFIFVGFIAVLVGMIIEYFNREWIGMVISSLCGFVFLTIAGKFSMEGDTLQMLVAVLNSNFWLSTHVLSITTGYAGVCVAGIVGHIYILQSIFGKRDKNKLERTYHILVGTLGFGLIMAFLGTNLGGIWADQSWGRFWGWDPKENGALLIILWTAILFHAKIAKIIGPFGLAVGSVIGIMVVMWAWFGVNLLSVGLHSYGFTSGLAVNLGVYYGLQILFLVIAVPLARRKLGKQ